MAEQRRVLVVTDSTSDIPRHYRSDLGITVVPLSVSFGTESFRDGIDLSLTQFLERLQTAPELPKTSQPPIADFEAVFRDALERGLDVVCITISAALSGTHNSARLAAETVNADADRIRVIDSRGTSMQLGWIVIDAARLATTGASLADVAARAESAVSRVKLYAVLQTLDYVYKGGRIGKASKLVGTALAIKPVLSIVDGVLVPVERVRTWKKAVTRVAELITPTPTDIMVLHSHNLSDAQAVAAQLQQAYPQAKVDVDYAGATITTYAGPGALGVMALYP